MSEYTLEASIFLAAIIISSALLTQPTGNTYPNATIVQGATVTSSGSFGAGISIEPGAPPEEVVAYPEPEWAKLDDEVRYPGAGKIENLTFANTACIVRED